MAVSKGDDLRFLECGSHTAARQHGCRTPKDQCICPSLYVSQLVGGRRAISDAEDRLDIARPGWVGLDLFSQIANMHIDRALNAAVIVALQSFEQQLTRENPSGRFKQRLQQRKLRR